mmetsp:Transcript_68537/g.189781  ORF Transcript_68537/g.189781 Transcript_68537/m.189781 type:complete len:104 (+) Transcript_68537:643-954(+)
MLPPDAPFVEGCVVVDPAIVGMCEASSAVRCKFSFKNFCPAAVDMRFLKRETVNRLATEMCFDRSPKMKAFPVRMGSCTWSAWKAKYSAFGAGFSSGASGGCR